MYRRYKAEMSKEKMVSLLDGEFEVNSKVGFYEAIMGNIPGIGTTWAKAHRYMETIKNRVIVEDKNAREVVEGNEI